MVQPQSTSKFANYNMNDYWPHSIVSLNAIYTILNFNYCSTCILIILTHCHFVSCVLKSMINSGGSRILKGGFRCPECFLLRSCAHTWPATHARKTKGTPAGSATDENIKLLCMNRASSCPVLIVEPADMNYARLFVNCLLSSSLTLALSLPFRCDHWVFNSRMGFSWKWNISYSNTYNISPHSTECNHSMQCDCNRWNCHR